ncbi:MAG: hypothetical protein IPF51_16195 [Dehalococcoidia bacterium]|uniref:hypothetical protein n=1 Tax=Candidatus Amarobacter glycogenicus TaxID=3140699 RepID=UPI003134CDB9|nr:hypothetical protein [Dehalococcoidia bacterium]
MRQRPTNSPRLPELIQEGWASEFQAGGWRELYAMAGQRLGANVLGVVSDRPPGHPCGPFTGGDKDVARALNAFDPEAASEIMDQYAVRDPSKARGRRKLPPKPEVLVNGSKATKSKMTKLAVASAFVEVWLAKEGHSGPIGINVLEKVQLMHLPVLLGR